MSYGTDNDLSRPSFGAGGVPQAQGNVYGQYTQGQGNTTPTAAPYQAPAQQHSPPAYQPNVPVQPQFQAPAIAPAAQPQPNQFNQGGFNQGFQPNYGQQYANAPAQQPPVGLEQPVQPYGQPVPQGNYGVPVQQTVQTPPQPAAPTPTAQPVPQSGSNYIETSINHLTSSLGVSADKFDAVIASAIQYGDPNLINPAALGVQLTPEQTAQVQSLAQGAVQYVNAENSRVDNIAYTAAGGKAQWDQAAGVFSSSADANTKGYVEYLVSTGQHEQAAQVVLNTVRGYGYQPQGQAPIQASAIAGQQGLTSAEFKDQIGKLKMEAGNQSLESGIFGERYQALIQQRALGAKQGLN